MQSVLIVGVGGQGVLLASELLSAAALEAGFDVKKSDVHGMSQRGGSVSSYVRFGDKVFSPLIPIGGADVILAFESAEALRWIHFLKPGGACVVNDKQLVPPIALIQKEPGYPIDVVERIRKHTDRVTLVQADSIASELGNPKVENVVLLGALSASLDIPEAVWTSVIRGRVPKGTEDINLAAFNRGRLV